MHDSTENLSVSISQNTVGHEHRSRSVAEQETGREHQLTAADRALIVILHDGLPTH